MFRVEAGRRYDMPVGFGPSILPGVSIFGEIEVITIPFRTNLDAVRSLIPSCFDIAERPLLNITCTTNRKIDYLAGRGYNIVDVSVVVTYNYNDRSITGPFHLILWESDPHPVVQGRELAGWAKVYAQIPDGMHHGNQCEFACMEYDTVLVSGGVNGLSPVSDSQLRDIQGRTRETSPLGYKFIPGPKGTIDVQYPTRLVSRRRYHTAFAGEGWVRFGTPTFEQAPISARFVDVLRTLPMESAGHALLLRGSGELPRDEWERLPDNANSAAE